jgi:hypothetical protein
MRKAVVVKSLCPLRRQRRQECGTETPGVPSTAGGASARKPWVPKTQTKQPVGDKEKYSRPRMPTSPVRRPRCLELAAAIGRHVFLPGAIMPCLII